MGAFLGPKYRIEFPDISRYTRQVCIMFTRNFRSTLSGSLGRMVLNWDIKLFLETFHYIPILAQKPTVFHRGVHF